MGVTEGPLGRGSSHSHECTSRMGCRMHLDVKRKGGGRASGNGMWARPGDLLEQGDKGHPRPEIGGSIERRTRQSALQLTTRSLFCFCFALCSACRASDDDLRCSRLWLQCRRWWHRAICGACHYLQPLSWLLQHTVYIVHSTILPGSWEAGEQLHNKARWLAGSVVGRLAWSLTARSWQSVTQWSCRKACWNLVDWRDAVE